MTTLLKVLRFLGPISLFFSLFVGLPSYLLSLYGGQEDSVLGSIVFWGCIYSLVIFFTLRRSKFNYTPRDGFIITFLSWVLVSIVAAIPFIGFGMSSSDAFFEAVSGLTTTGSTSISNLAILPDYMLMYRQLLQWAGGVGLVIIVIAIIPAISGGVKILQAETAGFAEKSFSPRLQETARSLLKFYLVITMLCALSYWLVGMTVFESFAHSFSTVSIGGFSIYNDNFGHFNNQAVEVVAVVFMLLSATNFGLHFISILKRSLKYYRENDEFKFFKFIVIFSVLMSVLILFFRENLSLSESLRYGVFQTVSIITTTGFTLVPLNDLGTVMPFYIFIISFIGACSGSFGGGMKVWRVFMLLKIGFNNITKLMHPNAVNITKISGEKVASSQIEAVFSFVAIYITFFLVFLFILLFQGVDFYSAFSGTAAAINNLGPGLGEFTHDYSTLGAVGKYTLAFAMIVGRLELFGVLILFFPSFWKN